MEKTAAGDGAAAADVPVRIVPGARDSGWLAGSLGELLDQLPDPFAANLVAAIRGAVTGPLAAPACHIGVFSRAYLYDTPTVRNATDG